MHDQNRKDQQTLQLARQRGTLRPRDLDNLGIEPSHLQRLYEQGKLLRTSRGIYTHPDAPLQQFQELAEVALRAPRAVLCLLSALAFHGIGTQLPHQVWIALPPHTHPPRLTEIPLRTVQMSDTHTRVQRYPIGTIPVPITDPARTVVDCFKFRNKIGIHVALEALHDGWRRRCFTLDDLADYARLCRQANVLQPYLESLSL